MEVKEFNHDTVHLMNLCLGVFTFLRPVTIYPSSNHTRYYKTLLGEITNTYIFSYNNFQHDEEFSYNEIINAAILDPKTSKFTEFLRADLEKYPTGYITVVVPNKVIVLLSRVEIEFDSLMLKLINSVDVHEVPSFHSELLYRYIESLND